MKQIEVHNRCSDFDSYRAERVKSLFNAESGCDFRISAELPADETDWRIGVIVGPSGSGKSSLGRQFWHGVPIARFGALAFAKAWRRLSGGQQCLILTCHRDILDWIQPDWVFDTATGSQAGPCSGSAIPWTAVPWRYRTGALCAPRIPHRASGGGNCSPWACASSATPWMRSGRDGSSCGIRITASPPGNRRSTARPVSTVPNCRRSAQRRTAGPSSSKPHNQNSTKPRSVQPAGAFLRHSRARKHNDPHSATITTQPPDRTTENTLLRGPDPRRVFVAVCTCCRLRMGSCGLYYAGTSKNTPTYTYKI